jgi:hypothetical protein
LCGKAGDEVFEGDLPPLMGGDRRRRLDRSASSMAELSSSVIWMSGMPSSPCTSCERSSGAFAPWQTMETT